MNGAVPVYTISLDEYRAQQEPDYEAVGCKLDALIQKHFPGQRITIRGISLMDHPGRSRDDLVSTIKRLGTARSV